MIPFIAILCFWYWKLADLFHFYERGLIFATGAVRCIKMLGFCCVINWLLMVTFNTLLKLSAPPPTPVAIAPPTNAVHMVQVATSSLHMSFFNFSYGSINVGLLLAGTVIMIIAWIMDEGRKIQEEQELTV